MAVAELAAVIPLRSHPFDRLIPLAETQPPEPAELYCRIVLTFFLHAPVAAGDFCGQCGQSWPCPPIVLAFRLREGF